MSVISIGGLRQRMPFLEPRPPWPPQPLIDLAASRDPGAFGLTPEFLELAFEHRMGGLLWSYVKGSMPCDDLTRRLAAHDLRTQAHLVRVRSLLGRCVRQLRREGIEVASIKGPITESRWYHRAGERPCSDVDLWLSPHQLDRAGDALELLQPDHPWVPFFGDLARTGAVQAVTLRVDGIEVDLHLDLLKTGLPTVGHEEIWARTEEFELADGTPVRVLDATTALFHFLVHLNKDRFQRLLGYADVARIIDGGVDWRLFDALARTEDLERCTRQSCAVVLSDLQRPGVAIGPVRGGVRAAAWSVLWRRHIRLWGYAGRRRFRWRQLSIVLLAEHRSLRVRSSALLHELFPPTAVLEAQGRPVAARRLWELLLRRP